MNADLMFARRRVLLRRQPQRRQERPLQRPDRPAHDRLELSRHHRRGRPRLVPLPRRSRRGGGLARGELASPPERGRAGDVGPPRRRRQDATALVVQVADAKDLRRALLLTLQLGQLEVPTVLTLNMSDEAEARGLRIDTEGLSRALGVPVRPTVATRGEGIGPLRDAPRRRVLPRTTCRSRRTSRRGWPSIFCREDAPPDPEAPPPFVARYHEAMLAHARPWRAGSAAALSTDGQGSRAGRLRAPPGTAMRPPASGAGRSCCWSSRIVYLVVGVFGAGTLVDLLEDGLFGRVSQPVGQGRVRPRAERFPAGPLRRAVRRRHHGPDLRPGHRAAHRDHLLPGLRRARGLGLPAAPRGDERPRLPGDGPQRQGGPAHGAGPGLRHHGHA